MKNGSSLCFSSKVMVWVATLPSVCSSSLPVLSARKASQERGTAGTAKRKLAVSAIKAHSPRGQPVDVRRFDRTMAVAAEVVVHIVHGDEQNVQLLIGRAERSGKHHRQPG